MGQRLGDTGGADSVVGRSPFSTKGELMRKTMLLIPALAFALSGCFFVSKKPANNSSSSAASGEPKNHGQERSAEVHERNEEKKAEKDAEKAEKKADKK